MKYILITSKGSVKTFYVEAVAELYKTICGGVVIKELYVDKERVNECCN